MSIHNQSLPPILHTQQRSGTPASSYFATNQEVNTTGQLHTQAQLLSQQGGPKTFLSGAGSGLQTVSVIKQQVPRPVASSPNPLSQKSFTSITDILSTKDNKSDSAVTQATYLNGANKILTPTAATFMNNSNQQITVVLQPSSILQNPAEALQAAKRAYPQPHSTLEIKKVKLVEQSNLQNVTPLTATGTPPPPLPAPVTVTKVEEATPAPTATATDALTSRVSEVSQLLSYELHSSTPTLLDGKSVSSMKQLTTAVLPVSVVATNAQT
jgi:hypothetical protein